MTDTVGLPGGWAATELGQIRADLSRTLDPRQYPDEDFELYSVPSFADGEPEIVRGSAIGSTKMTLTPGTVVVCKINPRINRVWVVGDRSPHKKIGSGEWIPFFPVDGVTPHFLAYYLQRDHFRNFLAARVSGVGGSLMRVRPMTLDEYPLPIPSVSEQNRIVEAIESYVTRLDSAVALLERVEQNLKRYRAAVLKAAVEGRLVPTEAELARREGRTYEPASELLKRILAERKARWIEDAAEKARAKAEEKARKLWTAEDNAATLEKERAKAAKQYKEPAAPDTTDLPELPVGWCWVGIRQLCAATLNALKAGPFGSSLKKECYVAEGYKIYGQEQVLRQDPFYGNYYIDEEKYLSLQSCAVSPGDLLISLVGTIGRTLLLPTSIKPGIINPRLIKVSLDPSVVLGEFVQIYLQSPRAREVFALASHGGTMEILNMAILSELAFPLPPLSEQKAILNAVDEALSIGDRAREDAKEVARRTTRLRQSILKWAFEGKLVEQDPDDEPASALLERIKAERAAVGTPRARGNRRSAE